MWNVSESTVKRWADSGDLVCVRTRGGHRRFSLDEIMRFQRSQGFEAVGGLVSQSESTSGGLPEVEQAMERRDDERLSRFFSERALEGDAEGLGVLLARSYLRGIPPVEILEDIVTPAMHEIGRRWRSGELTVADEHVATRAILDALTRFQPEMLSRPGNGKCALVGCPEDELHEVASRLVACLLELEGWSVVKLGMNTPFYSFRDAVEQHRPQLVCVSSTLLEDLDRQSRDFAGLIGQVREMGARLVIGGAGFADPALRARFPHDAYCTSLRELLRFIAPSQAETRQPDPPGY